MNTLSLYLTPCLYLPSDGIKEWATTPGLCGMSNCNQDFVLDKCSTNEATTPAFQWLFREAKLVPAYPERSPWPTPTPTSEAGSLKQHAIPQYGQLS